MSFSNVLIEWYLQNKRDLPWRNTTNPYPIWLSEIILQQTRVAQGLPYFLSFLDAFPTVFDLAKADEQEVLKLWQGLGYYSRARNLHHTAKYIMYEYNGEFPDTYQKLLSLKGVGEYTAAAIASFAYHEPVPVVDGNVFRVLSRYFDLNNDVATISSKKVFKELAFELMPKDNPHEFNQAIMEFGALQCVPKNPDCFVCVFNSSCLALKNGTVTLRPVKSKKNKVTSRFFNYLIFEDPEGKTMINKRTEKGIWKNLYEFPLIETDTEIDFDFLERYIETKYESDYIISAFSLLTPVGIIHKLSHQHLNVKFWKVKIKTTLEGGLSLNEVKQFPFPIVIYNFIETL